MLALIEIPDWAPYVAAAAAVVGAIVGTSTYLTRKRTQALTVVASEIGFAFSVKDEQQAPHLQTSLYTRGHGRYFRNIMTGTAGGMRCVLFDYQFTIGAGRYSHTYRQTIAAYTKTGVWLPVFEIKPRGLWKKITSALSRKPIEFDSHPELMRSYYVNSEDEQRTRALLTAGALSFLQQLDPKRKWSLEGDGDTLIVYRSEKRVKPPDLRTFLEETSSLAGQFFSLGNCKR